MRAKIIDATFQATEKVMYISKEDILSDKRYMKLVMARAIIACVLYNSNHFVNDEIADILCRKRSDIIHYRLRYKPYNTAYYEECYKKIINEVTAELIKN